MTQISNTYDDDDFRQVVAEIEEMDAEVETIMATARGKVSAIRTRQKNRKKIAKAELKIPTQVLNAVLKQRGLERQLKKLTENVPDDMVELYEEASGQFSLFKPENGKTVAEAAASERRSEVADITEREQAEGAAVLDQLVNA